MRIYIAGPYSAETEDDRQTNVLAAMQAAVYLIRAGHTPYCPHLSHYIDQCAPLIGFPVSYEEWMAQDREWLRLCDAVLCLGSSPGADRECQLARALGLPVVHTIEEVNRLHRQQLESLSRAIGRAFAEEEIAT